MIIPTELEARVLWVMQGGAEWRAPSLTLQQVVPTEQAAYEILADLVEKGWVNRNLKMVAGANVTTYTITAAGREALTHTHLGAPSTQPHLVLDDEPARLPGILPDPPGYGTLTGLSEDDWGRVLTALERAVTASTGDAEDAEPDDYSRAVGEAAAFQLLYDRLATEEIFEFPANTRARKVGRVWCRIVPGLQGRILAFGGHGPDAYAWIDVRERRDG